VKGTTRSLCERWRGPFGQALESVSVERAEDSVAFEISRRQSAVDGGSQVIEGQLLPARLDS